MTKRTILFRRQTTSTRTRIMYRPRMLFRACIIHIERFLRRLGAAVRRPGHPFWAALRLSCFFIIHVRILKRNKKIKFPLFSGCFHENPGVLHTCSSDNRRDFFQNPALDSTSFRQTTQGIGRNGKNFFELIKLTGLVMVLYYKGVFLGPYYERSNHHEKTCIPVPNPSLVSQSGAVRPGEYPRNLHYRARWRRIP